jgi:glycine/D-amino acid oxidase-like deaminating enzyme
MVALMNRSIDLLEQWADESDNEFNLTRRGYLYVTADADQLDATRRQAGEISRLGAGPLRVHRGKPDDPEYVLPSSTGYRRSAEGADLFLDGDSLRRHFPYLSPTAAGGLHARRAGWFSAQQLGSWLLTEARRAGVELVAEAVVDVDTTDGVVRGVRLASGTTIPTGRFVNAAGPMLAEVGDMAGAPLPVFSEVHRKVSFRDTVSALPRTAPMLIWNDGQRLQWSPEERAALTADPALAFLSEELGPGAHCRPEGAGESTTVLGLWEYHTDVRPPEFPIPDDPLYPEIVLRGLSTMVPAFGDYLAHLPAPYVDGGYYTKTKENRPLIGPVGAGGSIVVGALSGYGVMAAAAAGELAALHTLGLPLPDYARWFVPDRYSNPEYLTMLDQMTDSGQI